MKLSNIHVISKTKKTCTIIKFNNISVILKTRKNPHYCQALFSVTMAKYMGILELVSVIWGGGCRWVWWKC